MIGCYSHTELVAIIYLLMCRSRGQRSNDIITIVTDNIVICAADYLLV